MCACARVCVPFPNKSSILIKEEAISKPLVLALMAAYNFYIISMEHFLCQVGWPKLVCLPGP